MNRLCMTWLAVLVGCSAEFEDGDVGTYVPASASAGQGGAAGALPDAGGSTAGTGGSAPPDGGSGYDPNVIFDWPEADPTLVCLPGTYSGQFNCQMNAGGAFPSGPITGPVSFVLKSSANGEFLEIENGTLTGTGSLVQFTADLVGKLDCATDRFHADAVNGTFFGGTFSGTLDGRLDRATQTLSGTWSLASSLSPPCIGPFNLVRMP
jgi:hypothetical protein